jgi:hypothetical protein
VTADVRGRPWPTWNLKSSSMRTFGVVINSYCCELFTICKKAIDVAGKITYWIHQEVCLCATQLVIETLVMELHSVVSRSWCKLTLITLMRPLPFGTDAGFGFHPRLGFARWPGFTVVQLRSSLSPSENFLPFLQYTCHKCCCQHNLNTLCSKSNNDGRLR